MIGTLIRGRQPVATGDEYGTVTANEIASALCLCQVSVIASDGLLGHGLIDQFFFVE
jgi:hypothetical protein